MGIVHSYTLDRDSMGKNKKKQNIENGVKNESPIVSTDVGLEKTNDKNDKPPSSEDKDIPIEDALEAWMNDDGGIIDEEDDTSPPADVKPNKEESIASEKTEEKKTEETKPSSGYKSLPMTDATDAWMMDDDAGMSIEDDDEEQEEEKTAEKKEDKPLEVPQQKENEQQPKNIDEKKSSGYKDLPMDDATDA